MKTVVFILDGVTSHIYVTVGLARRLSSRGFHVQYWGTARSKGPVEEQGFEFRLLEGLWSRYQDPIRLPTSLNFKSLLAYPATFARKFAARRAMAPTLPAALDRFTSQLDQALARTWPEFVILDPFLLAYFPFLFQRRIRTVVLSTKPLPIPDVAVPPYDSFLLPSGDLASRLRVRMAWRWAHLKDLIRRAAVWGARACSAYTYEDILREASRRTDFPLQAERVRRWLQPDQHFRSVREWAVWLPEMDLPRTQPLPGNIRYIGPCVDLERRAPLFAGRNPRATFLIYVAVGTVRFRWKDNVPFLRKVIQAFQNVSGVQLVISTGDERATRSLGTPPGNVQILDFVPQLDILGNADLVITHAGAGTLRECIMLQVPLLAYPRNHDQMGNSARIVHHRLGLRGHRKWDSPQTIRRKALAILHDDTFRRNLGRLNAAVRERESQLLAEALEDLGLQSHTAAHAVGRATVAD